MPRPVAGCVIATGARGAGGRVAPAVLAAPSLSGMGTGPTPVPRAGEPLDFLWLCFCVGGEVGQRMRCSPIPQRSMSLTPNQSSHC